MRRLGAIPDEEGTRFAVWSGAAEAMWVSLFDENDREVERLPLARGEDSVLAAHVASVGPGTRYGFRADGAYDPPSGYWFDPARLLTDPYAIAVDRPYRYDPRLAARRGEAPDTASLMPKALVTRLPDPPPRRAPLFTPGGLVYELSVRAFTMRHPDVPPELRGTVAALAHPAILDHLRRIGVSVVELMPVVAWIDERHLPPLGLTNAWGYNPVSFMALDPRLAPGGLGELRATAEALHAAGIGVILDLVFNHSGESDAFGPTLSLRGIDARACFRHDDLGLVNDTGCGNTISCDHPFVRGLILDALRHFVVHAGVDGFRFDLAPILGRTRHGFDPDAPLLREMLTDPLLADRILIAEPWDIGPGGYQLGRFPPPFLEWNDRYRDDLRRFWRGDGRVGDLATRLAGSSDIFGGGAPETRSLSFLAAHDGFALADVVAYRHKHNEANGEANRDGHDENLSWNNGVEGATDDPAILAARRRDRKALLASLFATRGAIMLTAGDEFGRTQRGNNNAYCQDNDITWLDWDGADGDLLAYVETLARLRAEHPALGDPAFLAPGDVDWLTVAATPLGETDWERADALLMRLDGVGVAFNRTPDPMTFILPPGRWRTAEDVPLGPVVEVGPRSVAFLIQGADS